MKKVLFFVILLLTCNIFCFGQSSTDTKFQIYEETLIRIIDLMDSIFPNQDTITYFFEKAHGITDSFPSSVKKHKINVVDLIDIKNIIESHPLNVWAILPMRIENRKFKVRIYNGSVSKFDNLKGMSRLGLGVMECIYLYDFEKECFIFEKWL